MEFNKKREIFSNLDKYIDKNTILYLGISGGPDSMFMFYLLKEYFQVNGLDFNNINILHFNHNYREESKKESEYLENIFKNYNFIYGEYNGGDYREENLRKERYNFFNKNVENLGKNSYLVLGHNLTDRIETTLLNMLRGCSIDGFLNMSFYSEKDGNYILRPLLYLSKGFIKNLCDLYEIFYFEDTSNKDTSLSKRNYIRENILSELENLSNKTSDNDIIFYESFSKIYNSLEEISIEENNYNLESIYLSKYWDVECGYKLNYDFLNKKDFIDISKELGFYKDISKSTIDDFLYFINYSTKGFKYLNGTYIFKSHGNLYIIKGKKYFWKKELNDYLKIDKKGTYKFGDFEVNIYNEEYLNSIIRFPKEGDKYKGKALSKYLLNKKIPTFWRNFIPVIEKENKIIDVLDYKIYI